MSSEDARLLAASSPAGMAHVCSRGAWTPFEHLISLNDHLLRLVGAEFDRLLVTMPPRHGKSVLISQWLPAWFLGSHPDRQVMLASYEATFARSWGRRARESLAEHGPWVFGVHVADEPRAADWWQVQDHNGVMVTAGVGGALTGKGADLLVIDDPVKNAEEAASETIRQKHVEWWQSTASTRLQPGGKVVLVMTRWHEADLAGWLLEDQPDRWTVLNLPAVSDAGDALCPELYDAAALAEIKRQVGAYYWAALYMQRPAPLEGFLFRREYFRTFGEDQVGAARFYVLHTAQGPKRFDQGPCIRFQTVDVAASEKETADYTVVTTWAATPEKQLLLLDVQRRRFEVGHMLEFVSGVNDAWDRCPIHVEAVAANVGTALFQHLRRQGRSVAELRADSDKLRRAQHAIVAYERGDVYHPRAASWLSEYEQELLSFPNAAHDDQVDCVAYACRLLPRLGHREGRQDVDRPHTITRGVMGQQF